ncbi:MAG: DUF2878 family protein [Rhodocyclaceae bacterium]|nr:DUF2878 family protein [Rhodocyclaceae bacterium]MBX3669646.1 DUF2878 family protein [Rhodocyclaceae bacterium]
MHAAHPTGGIGGIVATPHGEPSRPLKIANFLLFQAAWFAAVLGAARGAPGAGTAAIALALAWHLALAARPAEEARLIAAVTLVGLVFELMRLAAGGVVYASGQPLAALPPYWLIALWALLASSLNLSLRWLKGHYWRAGVIGLAAGPAAFAAGVRLGAARFSDTITALSTLAAGWCLLLPLLVWLSRRYDGYGALPAGSPRPKHTEARRT